jgi:hypothetical protein
VTAAYSGNGDFNASTALALTQTVNMANTTTTVTSSANPSVFGQAVRFTATVATVAPGSGTPTGTVTFSVDGVAQAPVNVVNGQATFTALGLSMGTHMVTAAYSGDGNFNGSTASALTQTVTTATTRTTVTTSANPSVFGQAVLFSATVAAVAPSGTPTSTVTFTVDGVAQAPVNLVKGQVTFTALGLGLGTHTMTAAYNGDGNFNASTAPALTQTVNMANTTTTVITSANPSVFDQAVLFTAAVAAVAPGSGTPTGTVTFSVDGAAQAPVNVANGQATFTALGLSVGMHTVTAAYSGDGNFNTSTAPALTQTVNMANTTTTVTSSANPSGYGQAVLFTATVAVVAPGGGTPTGTVTFSGDGAAQVPVNVANGQATFTAFALSVGTHTVTAFYSGDGNFNASLAPALIQTVNEGGGGNSGGGSSAPPTQVTGTPNERFVGQVYLDLLERPVDPSGLAAWTGALERGTTHAAAVQIIKDSPEYKTLVVQGYYRLYLHRIGEADGVRTWISLLDSGVSATRLREVFVSSPEYFQTRAGGTDTGFLDALYRDAFNRSLDPAGQDAWGRVLNGAAGKGRAAVAEGVFTSPEFYQNLVQSLYLQFLHRPADPTGMAAFTDALRRTAREQDVIAAIAGSDEYFSRVVGGT